MNRDKPATWSTPPSNFHNGWWLSFKLAPLTPGDSDATAAGKLAKEMRRLAKKAGIEVCFDSENTRIEDEEFIYLIMDLEALHKGEDACGLTLEDLVEVMYDWADTVRIWLK